LSQSYKLELSPRSPCSAGLGTIKPAMKKPQKTSGKRQKQKLSFSRFILDPVISLAILTFAFIALFLALQQFTASRGF